MNSYAMVLKINYFRSQVMTLERRIQSRGGSLFTYINLN